MTRLACLFALTLAACSSGSYTTEDAQCTELAPPGGAVTYRVECPARDGYHALPSCDGVAVYTVSDGGESGPGVRFGQRPECSSAGISCPVGGTPQCVYVPGSSDLPGRLSDARSACVASGYSVGICYVDPVTLEVIEIDADWTL